MNICRICLILILTACGQQAVTASTSVTSVKGRISLFSSERGDMYVKTIPPSTKTPKGLTSFYWLRHGKEELTGEYSGYLPGKLYPYLECEDSNCLVQLIPVRLKSDLDLINVGKISALTFYKDGKITHQYSTQALKNYGLEKHVRHLGFKGLGQFFVNGFYQFELVTFFQIVFYSYGGLKVANFNTDTGKVEIDDYFFKRD